MHYYKQGLSFFSLLLLLTSNTLAANLKPLSLQQSQLVIPGSAISTMQMPRLDNLALIQRDITINNALANPKPIIQFAEPQITLITPQTHGMWETVTTKKGIIRVWRMTIQSTGAVSMNLGFTNYTMPKGGELYIYAKGHTQIYGPYTETNNQNQNQLWTPIILGDSIIIELNIPQSKEKDLILELTKINHGYKDFTAKATTSVSGSCNIDVICPEGDAWRNQIRSVAVYSFQGSRICTGAAINNTAQDNTPYFLTADHCGISAVQAPSVVVYWNFENTYCRKGATIANPGDGSLNQNTITNNVIDGATFVAGSSASDFTLLKLNKAILPEFNVFLAGWDRSQDIPNSGVGIHHPSIEEKRISVVPPAYIGIENLDRPKLNIIAGTHFRVLLWQKGTTEGGSSGSPLFDQNKRIVGQLHGGASACSDLNPNNPNTSSDFYGRLNVSWSGGGTPNSRLSDWLDPANSGLMVLNGKNVNPANTTNLLENNIPISNLTSSTKSSLEFSIIVPDGALNLKITTRSTTSDADLYVKYGSSPTLSFYDVRSWNSTSNEDIKISLPRAGTYYIKIHGFTNFDNLTLTASFDTISTGSTLKIFNNSLNTFITNESIINSYIMSNYNNLAGIMKVDINIKHTDSNDLSINLIAPNNQIFNIKNASQSKVQQNFIKSMNFTIPAGIANGLWKLEIQDNTKLDTGYLESWKLSLP